MAPRMFLASMVLLTGLLSPGRCASQEDCKVTVLQNGLRVIVRPSPNARVVAIDVWVRAGSAYEHPGEAGAAHFVEHVIFKGTAKRGPGEIDTAIEDLGSLLNAGTTRDAAHFWTTVAPEHLAPALEVVADAVEHATLPSAEVDRERTVILAEIARNRSLPARVALDELYAAIFPGHPYASPVSGTAESITHATANAVHTFHERLYRPDATTVVIVGTVSTDEATALATRLFSGWAKPLAPPAELPQITSTPPLTTSHPAVAGRAMLAVGVQFPADARSTATAAIAMRLIGDGTRGRVAHALAGKITTGDSSVETGMLQRSGVATVILACQPAQLDELRSTWVREAKALSEKAPDEGEVTGVKRFLHGRILYETETCEGQARLLGSYDISTGDYRKAKDIADAIDTVKPSDVQDFARKFLTPGAAAVAVFGVPTGNLPK